MGRDDVFLSLPDSCCLPHVFLIFSSHPVLCVNHQEMQKAEEQYILRNKYSSLSSMEKWKEVDIDGDEFKHIFIYYSVFYAWIICC